MGMCVGWDGRGWGGGETAPPVWRPPVEGAALVALARLAQAELLEVLSCEGHDVLLELHHDAAQRRGTQLHIKVHLGVGLCVLGGKGGQGRPWVQGLRDRHSAWHSRLSVDPCG